jgi:hypothetical protein
MAKIQLRLIGNLANRHNYDYTDSVPNRGMAKECAPARSP